MATVKVLADSFVTLIAMREVECQQIGTKEQN
jgi:hypothetical protein